MVIYVNGVTPCFLKRRTVMDENLLFYWDRTNKVNLIDRDTIPHFNDGHPILNIVVDILNAGYGGVIIDEQRLSNGKYFQALSVNLDTPEGAIVSILQKSFNAGDKIPTSSEVIESINLAYATGEDDEY